LAQEHLTEGKCLNYIGRHERASFQLTLMKELGFFLTRALKHAYFFRYIGLKYQSDDTGATTR
jgi:hypothetical protein